MVGMTNLRNFLTELGFDNVKSLLQSGNLVFGSRSRFGAELERYLEMEAAKRLALEIDIYARTVEEWKSVVRQNPFRKEAERDPGHLVVLFLKNAPAAKDGRGTGRNWNTVLKLDVIAKAGSMRLTPVAQRRRI